MTHSKQTLIRSIPSKLKSSLGYYPDTLFFDYSKKAYLAELEQLAKASKIYTDGYSLRKTGYLKSFWQSFKGVFGLTNHCQQEKVQMALYKFAYYGYCKGYIKATDQKYFAPLIKKYFLNSTFLQHFFIKKTDENTITIQRELVKFYMDHSKDLNPKTESPHVNPNYPFGKTLGVLEFWKEIPGIDPQNDILIKSVLSLLEPETGPQFYTFLPESKYAYSAADLNIKRAKDGKGSFFYNLMHKKNVQSSLERALILNPQILYTQQALYIEYYFEKNDLQNALHLIATLKDSTLALKYIAEGKYTQRQLEEWLVKDSWLAIIVSEHHMKTKDYNDDSLNFAAKLISNFAQTHPIQAFSRMVHQHQNEEAYKLFTEYRNEPFVVKDTNELSAYYANLGNALYTQGHEKRDSKNWADAEALYQKSVEAKNRARELNEKSQQYKNDYFTHLRLYAQLLIDADIDTFKNPEDSQIQVIIKAINLLISCKSTETKEKGYHTKALAKGYMRQVDYLVTLVLAPLGFGESASIHNQHMEEHKLHFAQLIATLKEIIELLKNTKDSDLKPYLAKAYFLLADVCDYFDLKESYPSYFELAHKTVPSNAFYLLRYAEKQGNGKGQLAQQGILALKSIHYSVTDYANYDEERWLKEKRTSNIKDIHTLEPSTCKM